MHSLQALFEATLKDVYFAEHAILKAMPKMEGKATARQLKRAFSDHFGETQAQVARLDEIFMLIGKRARGRESPALRGLMQQTETMISVSRLPEIMDAGLIGCAQAVEHYEIARYGTLIAWAEQLQLNDAIELLEETLEEEEATDERLADIAMGVVDPRAAEEDHSYEAR